MNPALILVVLLIGLVACKKQAPAVAPSAPAAQVDAAATDAAAAPTPTTPPKPLSYTPSEQTTIADAGVEANLAELSQQLRTFIINNRGAPRDWDDFVARARVSAPPPPPGQKYAIQKAKVVLVKQ